MSKDPNNREAVSDQARPGTVPIPKMRRGFRSFINDVSREMKHVTWPQPKETNRLTGVVLAVCVGITLVLLLLSTAFDQAFIALFRSN